MTKRKAEQTPSAQVYTVLCELHTYINYRVFKQRKSPLPMPVFSISSS